MRHLRVRPKPRCDPYGDLIELVKRAETRYGIKDISDWYSISPKDIIRLPGASVLRIKAFSRSLHNVLGMVYPERSWEPWKFAQVPKRFWDCNFNRVEFIKYVEQVRGIRRVQEWAKVTITNIRQLGGSGIFTRYKNCKRMLALVSEVYPEWTWNELDFAAVSARFWAQPNKRLSYLRHLEDELGVKKIEDWYLHATKDVQRLGAYHLLTFHDQSLPNFLQWAYPEYRWLFWKFRRIPHPYWHSLQSQQMYARHLEEELGYDKLEDYYKLTWKNIAGLQGQYFVRNFANASPADFVSLLYPEVEWDNRKFNFKQRNHWGKAEHHFRFIRKFEAMYNITALDDYYALRSEHLEKAQAGGFVQKFKISSILKLVRFFYPEHEWKELRFSRVPMAYWKNTENVDNFIINVERKHGIRELDDWYRISLDQMARLGSGGLKRGWPGVLTFAYPEHSWDMSRLTDKQKKALQSQLHKVVKRLLPNVSILEEYRLGLLLVAQNSDVILDVFIPEFSLALEYQGHQHYWDVPVYGSVSLNEARDSEKARTCKTQGISLISIPYWWQGDADSIVATILHFRPDIDLEWPVDAKPLINMPTPTNDSGKNSRRVMHPTTVFMDDYA